MRRQSLDMYFRFRIHTKLEFNLPAVPLQHQPSIVFFSHFVHIIEKSFLAHVVPLFHHRDFLNCRPQSTCAKNAYPKCLGIYCSERVQYSSSYLHGNGQIYHSCTKEKRNNLTFTPNQGVKLLEQNLACKFLLCVGVLKF